MKSIITWKTQAHIRDNIEMDLQEIEWEGADWIHMGQDSDQ
jgi:hypothetical protein